MPAMDFCKSGEFYTCKTGEFRFAKVGIFILQQTGSKIKVYLLHIKVMLSCGKKQLCFVILCEKYF